MKSKYDIRTEKERAALDGNRTSYTPNKIYKGADIDCLYYINTRGYYHILKPGLVRWHDGRICCYTIDDYLLTPENTLHLTEQTDYGTIIEVRDAMQKMIDEAA